MPEKLPTTFKDSDYLKGRVPLPPDVYGLSVEDYSYCDDVAVVNGQTGSITLAIEDDSHFLCEGVHILSSLQTTSMDLITAQITESASGRSWSNRVVPLRDLAGLGCVPKYLTDPNLLRPASSVTIQFTNNTGSNVQIYAALIGKKIYDLDPRRAAFMARRQWFQYVLNVSTLAAGVNQKFFNVQIENKADFLLKRILSQQLWAYVMGATAGSESAEIMWNLRNKSTGKSLFNKKAAARLQVGQIAGEFFNNSASWSPGNAFPFKSPWNIRRNTIIEGEFDNRSNGATGELNFVLEGIKVFDV